MASFGSEVVGNSPEELRATHEAEEKLYGALIRELGIKMDR